MKSDEGYARYFSYLNYFVLSMLVLVLGGNFIVLIIGWAGVGAASYMLISFWYRRTTATTAGLKAFVINVVGDVGLVLGTFFIFTPHPHDLVPGHVRRRARTSSTATRPISSRAACCSSSGPSPSRPRSRCTPGFPTRWRARRRSPR